jgi:hypothetical protein
MRHEERNISGPTPSHPQRREGWHFSCNHGRIFLPAFFPPDVVGGNVVRGKIFFSAVWLSHVAGKDLLSVSQFVNLCWVYPYF